MNFVNINSIKLKFIYFYLGYEEIELFFVLSFLFIIFFFNSFVVKEDNKKISYSFGRIVFLCVCLLFLLGYVFIIIKLV